MTATKKSKPINKLRVSFILFGLLIPVINWLIFYVYVNFSSIAMAFTSSQGTFSLENFARFFTEFTMETSDMRNAFVNTFITFGVVFKYDPFSKREEVDMEAEEYIDDPILFTKKYHFMDFTESYSSFRQLFSQWHCH